MASANSPRALGQPQSGRGEAVALALAARLHASLRARHHHFSPLFAKGLRVE